MYLVAAGKAAWPMTRAFCATRERIAAGVVSGPRDPGFTGVPPRIDDLGGAHPWPDAASERAGRRALEIAAASRRGGTLVVLLSGGASSMLAVPADGITLEDKAASTRALMDAGTPIDRVNCVRKHLSAIKGGQLAAAAGQVVTLAISDVHGPVEDDPTVIGSGPTVPDPTTFGDAMDVIGQSRARMPSAVIERISRGAAGEIADTPKGGASGLSAYRVIGTRTLAMEGARARAVDLGYSVHVIAPPTQGEAQVAARLFVESALRAAAHATRPVCVIASGETTVHVRGGGRGGRNQEFALAAVPLLSDAPAAALGSAGTDGIDGPTDAAGAVADTGTLARAEAMGLSWADALRRNASYDFFAQLEELIMWGPTGTNVGDVHVMMVGKQEAEP